uniref:HSF-type DNA-binding domain-containing protein n=1 Tax=Denticeps clupeoides TaxID=299321 RepID=A0AAY4ESC2_9TELE
MKQSCNVPAFLTKLWTLVEDGDTNEFICWSQEGNSFLVLDEQRFAKEILPKFFKHNNMASFVRQLNMYGFRKVMHIDMGVVKQERDGPIEFQHPYFKHGQDDLLEHIKRKVSAARPEENKIRQDDLSKILASVQNVHGKQETMDSRLATLKRENESLWREISDLRQKHSNQQKVIKELIQFIFTLVQNNRMLNLKRKRPLLLNGNGKKSKFIHQIYDEVCFFFFKCSLQAMVNGLNGLKDSGDISDDVIICNVTDEEAEMMADSSRPLDQADVDIIEVGGDDTVTQTPMTSDATASVGPEEPSRSISDCLATSSALQLNSRPSGLIQEDPVKMMDSILSENGAITQNISLLGKVELMDYLDSIDCSLEDFQAMLCGKQFSIDADIIEVNKQLIQYTTCPLLAFLDGCTPLAPAEPLTDSLLQQNPTLEEPADLLAPMLEEEEKTPRSTLIRLEPLTEDEAREATLFYLCELNPDGPSSDMAPLEL